MADTCPVARRRVALNALVVVGDTHKAALMTTSYTPGAEDFVNTHEISSAGYTAGGQTVAMTNATGTNKAYSDPADTSWTGLTASPRWHVIYRTSDNKVVFEQDLGVQSLSAANLTVTQPTAAEGTAAIRL